MSVHEGTPDDLLTIDELAVATGMTVRTTRYYASLGLLPPPTRRGRLAYYSREHRARLEVCDRGPGFEPPAAPAPRPGGGGMGLMLVDRVSAAWGVRRDDGACVWFELGA